MKLDLYIGLTKTLGAVDLSIGYTYYMFPGASDDNTEEVFLGISTELGCGLGLALTYYEDIDQYSGGYFEFEAAKSFELSECIVVDVAAGVAWCDDYELNTEVDGSNMDGFNHWYISAAVPFELKEDVYTDSLHQVRRHCRANLIRILSDDVEGNDDLFYGGVTLSIAF